MAPTIRETDLYAPVKTLLESQGYEVKGEVGAADVVAVRGDEEPVIVELKNRFSLTLFHQGIERQTITDAVYVAIPLGSGAAFHNAFKSNITLCRRLGLGLMTIRMRDKFVEVHVDPGPYRPRQSKPKKRRLLKEFKKRVGDPNMGGATRKGLITAYRQDALRCLAVLNKGGATKAADVAKTSGVPAARRLMADDHYGWFERESRGVYQLTPKGREAIEIHSQEIDKMVGET